MLFSTSYPQAIGLICLFSLILMGCAEDKTASSTATGMTEQKIEKATPSTSVDSDKIVNSQEMESSPEVKNVGDMEVKTVTSKFSTEENPTKESESSVPVPKKPIVEKTASRKQKKARAKLLPNLEFDLIRHNFDTIISGDVIDYKFEFTNTGKGPLVIESAKATCGCTQPSYPFIPIEPGERGYIGVTYNSVGKEGQQKPLITVRSNASKEPIALMLTGFVEPKKKAEEKEKDLTQDTLSKG